MSLPYRARRTGARPDRRRGSQAASSNSSCRSIRAGAIGGARDGRPTPARYHEHRSPIGQGSDNLHRAAAGGAHRHLNLEHAGQQPSPFDPVAMPARVVGLTTPSIVRRRRQSTGARYDLGPIRRRRRQHAMVTDQMQPRRRYQRRQFLQQLLGAQQQRRSTVSPRRLQRKLQRLHIDELQPPGGHRWTNDIPAQLFQALPVHGADTSGRV